MLAAATLGAGYGFCLVSGLLEVQRLARPGDLAGLTAIYYSLTYVGFAIPIVLAELVRIASYTTWLLGLAALSVTSLLFIRLQSPRRPRVLPRHRSTAE